MNSPKGHRMFRFTNQLCLETSRNSISPSCLIKNRALNKYVRTSIPIYLQQTTDLLGPLFPAPFQQPSSSYLQRSGTNTMIDYNMTVLHTPSTQRIKAKLPDRYQDAFDDEVARWVQECHTQTKPKHTMLHTDLRIPK